MSFDRSLTADEQRKVRELRDSGWSPAAIAHLYSVSKRTVYRYLKGSLVDVQVGAYTTTFLLEPGRNPRRATPWKESA